MRICDYEKEARKALGNSLKDCIVKELLDEDIKLADESWPVEKIRLLTDYVSERVRVRREKTTINRALEQYLSMSIDAFEVEDNLEGLRALLLLLKQKMHE